MLNKKSFWTMIGLWIFTLICLIIGLSCIGAKISFSSAADNGFKYLKDDYKGSISYVLDANFVSDNSFNNGDSQRIKEAQTLQTGVIFSVIIEPVIAVLSIGATATYFILSNREWKKHVPQNYIPKSRLRLMEAQKERATKSEQPTDK